MWCHAYQYCLTHRHPAAGIIARIATCHHAACLGVSLGVGYFGTWLACCWMQATADLLRGRREIRTSVCMHMCVDARLRGNSHELKCRASLHDSHPAFPPRSLVSGDPYHRIIGTHVHSVTNQFGNHCRWSVFRPRAAAKRQLWCPALHPAVAACSFAENATSLCTTVKRTLRSGQMDAS
jgi:hypothetical protein